MSDITALLVAAYIGIGLIMAVKLLVYVKVPVDASLGYKARRLFLASVVSICWPGALLLVILWTRSPYRHIIARIEFGKRGSKDDEDAGQ